MYNSVCRYNIEDYIFHSLKPKLLMCYITKVTYLTNNNWCLTVPQKVILLETTKCNLTTFLYWIVNHPQHVAFMLHINITDNINAITYTVFSDMNIVIHGKVKGLLRWANERITIRWRNMMTLKLYI